MEKEQGLKRRDFIKTTALGIAITGLDLISFDAAAQPQKDTGRKKDAPWAQERANQYYFVQRFNWAEATTLSFKEYLNIESPLIPRIAAGFGGGFGLKGSICGIFMGSVMAIGLRHGRNDAKDAQALLKVNSMVKQFSDRFIKEFGSRECWELAGHRIDTPEGFKKWADTGGVKRCNAMLRRTVQIMVDEYLI